MARSTRRTYAQVSSTEEERNNRGSSNEPGDQDENDSSSATPSTTRAAGSSRRANHRNRYNRVPREDDDDDGTAAAAGTRESSAPAGQNNNNNTNNNNETASVLTEASSLLDDEDDVVDVELGDDDNTSTTSGPSGPTKPANTSDGVDPNNDDGRRLTLVILDVAQQKFRVTVHPTATVADLKRAGAKVHKVSPDRQRLIYRGRMLQDDERLDGDNLNITAAETIIHLFPKPRVIIKENNNNNSSNAANNSEGNTETSDSSNDNGGDEETGEAGGARVPTIVLDADEADRRSQILVLGSSDYLEAQNNVKLFSFMLLIISSIELMNLLAVAMGVPQDNGGSSGSSNSDGYPVSIDDDIFNNSGDDAWNGGGSSNNATLGATNNDDSFDAYQWKLANWIDLFISVLGVYTGILGLQASTHNTLRLAKLYLTGTLTTGVAWMLFNLVMTYDVNKHVEEEREANNENNDNGTDDYDMIMDDASLRWQAVSVMVLPGMVWLMCCLRAWQFQHLLMEAEQEAEERIRSEFAETIRAARGESGAGEGGDGDGGDDDDNNNDAPATQHAPTNHDEELALQNQSARIS